VAKYYINILSITDLIRWGSCDDVRWRVHLCHLCTLRRPQDSFSCFPLFLSSVQLESSFFKFFRMMASSLEELGNYIQDILDEVCAIEFLPPRVSS